MKKKVVLPIVAVLVVAGVSTAWWFNQESERTLEEVFGNVEIRDVDLGFRVSGRVEEVLVEEGDSIEKGQVLAALDAEPYQLQLASAQAAARRAKSELQRLENGFRPEEITEGEAVLAERKAVRENAKILFERRKNLIQSNATSQQELDNAQSAYEQSMAGVNTAEAKLQLLKSGYRKEDIESARAQLAEAEANIEQIRLQIEDTKLKATKPGIVFTRAIEPGAYVNPGQTAFTVTLTDRIWVRAFIPEPDLGRIQPGQKAWVKTDSRKDLYPAKIGFIAPSAEFTPKNVETPELRTQLVYRFRVVLDSPDDALRQGMPVTVLLHNKADE